MSDIEKARIQRDAQRIAARRTSSSSSEAIIHHLGVELYKERRRTEHPRDHENPAGDEGTDK